MGITTSPNTGFIDSLVRSIGCRTRIETQPDFGEVVLSVGQAVEIGIFNLEVLTYRRKTLEKLAVATTFERHWPAWLQEKVNTPLDSESDINEVRDRILEEDNVFVRLKTLKRKKAKRADQQMRIEDAGGGI